MRIGIDIRCLLESKYSGISEYAYNLLDNLFKIDRENQYFLFYNASKAVTVPDFDYPNVSIKGFHYPNKLFNLAIRFFKIFQIDKMLGGVDVFLIPNYLFLNLSKNCRQILIVHDLSFKLYPEFFTLKRKLWHRLIGPKQLSEKVNEIIAISENTKNDLIKLYNLDENKIKVIYPGISSIFFEPISEADKERAKSRYNLPERYIFYLGNLEPRKNIESLIMAFEQIEDDNLYLVLAGSHAWKYDKINKLWQKSPAKKRIKFLGYVQSQDKPALYNLAAVFVYPSIYEGFGLPPVEAMASGTPVVSSFNSSLVESVADAGILIDPNNINDITQAVNRIIAEPDLREELIKRGMNHCQQFKWEKTAAKIKLILEQKI